jgi:hypothetical protein
MSDNVNNGEEINVGDDTGITPAKTELTNKAYGAIGAVVLTIGAVALWAFKKRNRDAAENY